LAEARLITGNSIEVILLLLAGHMRLASGNLALTATSWAPNVESCPEGPTRLDRESGLEFLPEGPTGPDGEPPGGG
jgi:hypothetical protein